MAGNVWEWTDSWYTQYPGNKWPSENYGEMYKTLKGGSWWDCSYYQCGVSAPVFNRSYFKQSVKNSSFGFGALKMINKFLLGGLFCVVLAGCASHLPGEDCGKSR